MTGHIRCYVNWTLVLNREINARMTELQLQRDFGFVQLSKHMRQSVMAFDCKAAVGVIKRTSLQRWQKS